MHPECSGGAILEGHRLETAGACGGYADTNSIAEIGE
jgi:hypothetical protein